MSSEALAGSSPIFELRARRAGEVVDLALRLTPMVMRRLLPAELALGVATALVTAIAVIGSTSVEDGSGGVNALVGLSIFISLCALGYLWACSAVAAYVVYLGDPRSAGSVARHVLGRVPRLLAYSIVASVVAGAAGFGVSSALTPLMFLVGLVSRLATSVPAIGTPLAVLTTIATMVAFYVAWSAIAAWLAIGAAAVAVESRKAFTSVGRGASLSRGAWMRNGSASAVLTLFQWMLLLVAFTIPWVVPGNPLHVSGPVLWALIVSVGLLAAGFIAVPMHASLTIAMLVDGKVRREALDLDWAMANPERELT